MYEIRENIWACGWQKIDGSWYYFSKGDSLMVTGCWNIEGTHYFFQSNGKLVTKQGWYKEYYNGYTYWYYVYNNGVCAKDTWIHDGNSWYYLDGLDYVVGRWNINGTNYFFDSSGKLVTKEGWKKDSYDGEWSYVYSNGVCVTSNWKRIDGYWYFFDGYGIMLSSDIWDIDGYIYCFNANGTMKTGWVSELYYDDYYDEEYKVWYYADTKSGAFVSGWKKINNEWYFFDKSSPHAMLTNGWAKDNTG